MDKQKQKSKDKGEKDKDKKKEKLVKEEKLKGGKGYIRNRSKRAGIIFPVVKVHRELKGMIPNKNRVNQQCSVYLAAVMEYVMAELLEIAGNTAKNNKKKRINPRHLMLSIKQDDELNTLIRATIAGGGVLPSKHIPTSSELRAPQRAPAQQSMFPPGQGRVDVFDEGEVEDEPKGKKPKKQVSFAGVPFQQPNLFAPQVGTPGTFGSAMGTPGTFGAGFMGGVPSHLGVPSVTPNFFAAGAGGLAVGEQKKKKKVAGKMQLPAGFGQ
ncbi:unnamed protein product [Amoebophrya sp. A25]|nr:unnamed protein product [Amoebophrya sp. A25]|eukprot:GSA25T00002693001.1